VLIRNAPDRAAVVVWGFLLGGPISSSSQVHFQLRRAKYFGCTLGEGANKLLNLRQDLIAFRSFIPSARRYNLKLLNTFEENRFAIQFTNVMYCHVRLW